MRIVFTGAQGTGKTTVLNHFKENHNIITEVVRLLSKQGVKINEMGNDEGQQTIFNEYIKLLSNKRSYISDRCLVDVLSYTKYLYEHGSVSVGIYRQQLDLFKKFLKDNKDIIYVYFPIEFDLVDDGVRSMDERFRKEIDNNIKSLLESNDVDYIVMSGTVDKRVRNVEYILSQYEVVE